MAKQIKTGLRRNAKSKPSPSLKRNPKRKPEVKVEPQARNQSQRQPSRAEAEDSRSL